MSVSPRMVQPPSFVSEIMRTGPRPPAEPPRSSRRDLVFVGVLSFCLALALVGILLVTWSLVARRSANARGAPPPAAVTSARR